MSARHPSPRGEFDFARLAPLRTRLSKAIASCPDSLHEKAWLTVMLSTALDGLAPQVEYPDDPSEQQLFALLCQVLGEGGNPAIVADPEPPWLENDLLSLLQAECRTWHASSQPYSRHQVYVRPDEDICEAISSNNDLLKWCEEGLQTRLKATGKVNFVHYFGEQQRCSVHVDNPEYYEFNCLIGLLHECPVGVEKSLLRIFEPDSVTDVQLDPGSAIVFHSSATPHGRTPLSSAESISLLSVGFRPADSGWQRAK